MADATTESPGMTDDEHAQLKELKAKEKAESRAAAAEVAAEAAEEAAERKDRIANRPLYHVLVRHMGRSARTRTMRAARAGHRRQGVLLDDGTRIRKKGRGRFTEVDLREFVKNNQRILEYIRVGSIEVCDPATEHALSYQQVYEMIEGLGAHMANNAQMAKDGYEQEVEQYEEALKKHEDDLAAWQEVKIKLKAEHGKKVGAARKKGESDPKFEGFPDEPEAPVKPVPPANMDMVGFDGADERGVQDDLVEGSTAENAAPNPDDAEYSDDSDDGEDEDDKAEGTGLLGDDGEDAGGDEDTTVVPTADSTADTTLDAAAVGDGDSSEGDGDMLTEEDLKKMSRAELDEVATANGLDPAEYSNMGVLIEALLKTGEE